MVDSLFLRETSCDEARFIPDRLPLFVQLVCECPLRVDVVCSWWQPSDLEGPQFGMRAQLSRTVSLHSFASGRDIASLKVFGTVSTPTANAAPLPTPCRWLLLCPVVASRSRQAAFSFASRSTRWTFVSLVYLVCPPACCGGAASRSTSALCPLGPADRLAFSGISSGSSCSAAGPLGLSGRSSGSCSVCLLSLGFGCVLGVSPGLWILVCLYFLLRRRLDVSLVWLIPSSRVWLVLLALWLPSPAASDVFCLSTVSNPSSSSVSSVIDPPRCRSPSWITLSCRSLVSRVLSLNLTDLGILISPPWGYQTRWSLVDPW